MTYHPKSDFMGVMIERGFLADCTDYQGLDDALKTGVVPGYIGFDATAKSLHVGSLIQIMMLRWLQKTGHKPITLMGGGTTMVNLQEHIARGEVAAEIAVVVSSRKGVKGLERVLSGIDQLAFVHLTGADVVRHQIVADIVAAYERDAESREPTAGSGRRGSDTIRAGFPR